MRKLTRRKAVLSSIGIGAAAIAGCVSDSPGSDDDDADNPTNGDDGNDGENDDNTGNGGTVDPSGSIERTGSDCGGPDSDTAAAYAADGVHVIEGTLPSPTPCYEPSLESTGYDDGTLSVSVDVVEEETDGTCVECTGEVRYEATVEGVAPDEVDSVEVTHVTGGTHTITEDEFGSIRPKLVSAELTDTGSETRSGESRDRSEVQLDDLSRLSGDGVERVEVRGTIPTETPHYKAVLEDASVAGTTLELAVGVESTQEDGEMGTQPLGVVTYTVAVELRNGDALRSARIEHPSSSHGAAWSSASGSASEGMSDSSGSGDGSSGSSDGSSGSGDGSSGSGTGDEEI
jgi:hypothetical protein